MCKEKLEALKLAMMQDDPLQNRTNYVLEDKVDSDIELRYGMSTQKNKSVQNYFLVLSGPVKVRDGTMEKKSDFLSDTSGFVENGDEAVKKTFTANDANKEYVAELLKAARRREGRNYDEPTNRTYVPTLRYK